MKTHPVGAELLHTDRWTDRHDSYFANMPKNYTVSLLF